MEEEGATSNGEPKGLEESVTRLFVAYSNLHRAERHHADLTMQALRALDEMNARRTDVDLARAALFACVQEAK